MFATNSERRCRQDRAIDGGAVVLGVLFVISLWSLYAGRHRESIEGAGNLLAIDVFLLVLYGVAGTWAAFQRSVNAVKSIGVGTYAGLILGSVHVAHHIVEFFVPLSGRTSQLVLGAGHMLTIFALFSIVGSTAWERTGSIAWATISGAWSAVVSVVILLAVACSLNFAFATRAEHHLHEAFLASGMSDADAFLVKNSFEAASEMLIWMPIVGVVLSLAGGLGNAWMSRHTRGTAYAVAWILPLAFGVSVISLWYADSLERAARPPFILMGLIFAGISLAGIPSVWFALRRAPLR